MSVAVSATREGANWIDRILTRRHSKKVAAAAHLLYNAGVIVVEMRGLRDQMKGLLRPLSLFNPTDWPEERRASWIEKLRSFAHDLPAFGVINQHAMALQQLSAPSKEIEELRDRLVELARNVTHLGEGDSVNRTRRTSGVDRRSSAQWHADVGEYQLKGREEEGDATFRGGPDVPDELIQMYLPALLWLVRHADASTLNKSGRCAPWPLVSLSRDRTAETRSWNT